MSSKPASPSVRDRRACASWTASSALRRPMPRPNITRARTSSCGSGGSEVSVISGAAAVPRTRIRAANSASRYTADRSSLAAPRLPGSNVTAPASMVNKRPAKLNPPRTGSSLPTICGDSAVPPTWKVPRHSESSPRPRTKRRFGTSRLTSSATAPNRGIAASSCTGAGGVARPVSRTTSSRSGAGNPAARRTSTLDVRTSPASVDDCRSPDHRSDRSVTTPRSSRRTTAPSSTTNRRSKAGPPRPQPSSPVAASVPPPATDASSASNRSDSPSPANSAVIGSRFKPSP